MKTLFILTKETDATIVTIMKEREEKSDIVVVDIREDQDYDALIESIDTCDQVITW